jgi:hypothetical protein
MAWLLADDEAGIKRGFQGWKRFDREAWLSPAVIRTRSGPTVDASKVIQIGFHTLEQAQEYKLERITELLAPPPGLQPDRD